MQKTRSHILKRTIQYTFDNTWKCTNTHPPLLSLIKLNKVQSIVCATFHELWVTLTRAEWSTRMGKGCRAMHADMRDLVFAKNVQLSYVISHVPLSHRIRGIAFNSSWPVPFLCMEVNCDFSLLCCAFETHLTLITAASPSHNLTKLYPLSSSTWLRERDVAVDMYVRSSGKCDWRLLSGCPFGLPRARMRVSGHHQT